MGRAEPEVHRQSQQQQQQLQPRQPLQTQQPVQVHQRGLTTVAAVAARAGDRCGSDGGSVWWRDMQEPARLLRACGGGRRGGG